MIKWLKGLFIVSIGLIFLFGVTKFDLISYLIMQAGGQFEVLWNARSVDEVLNDESVEPELKNKINLVKEVKAFAHTELGLTAEDLYTTVYDQKGQDILWNLSACEPFALESVEWEFPIVGGVSYKGFFDLEKAKSEEQILKDQGYDTRIRPVNAWSTLGWFSDPILSNNLNREEGSIAELFIHEITHANIFFKDSLTFNENLASFIGEQGALLFISKKYGRESKELEKYMVREQDAKKFIAHCLAGVKELEDLYKKLNTQMPKAEKQKAKDQYLANWVARLDTLSFQEEDYYHGRFLNQLPNNAFFMAFERYDSKKERFKDQLVNRFNGNLKSFIDFYKKQK